MQNKSITKIGGAILVICALDATQALAASCEDNFSTSGSMFTGKTYKTWADLPNAKFESAFKGAYMYTVKDGWKILQSDKEMGVIQAAQAASYAKGKTVPLNIAVEKSDAAMPPFRNRIAINGKTSSIKMSKETPVISTKFLQVDGE